MKDLSATNRFALSVPFKAEEAAVQNCLGLYICICHISTISHDTMHIVN